MDSDDDLIDHLHHLRWLAKDLRIELMLRRIKQRQRLRRKYAPNQPRVPAGNPDGGQWTSGGGIGVVSANSPNRRVRVAQAGFGHLIAEIPVPGGRRCVYNFGTFSVVAPGPTNFSCPERMPWFGVTHGQLLNDNRP